MAILDDDVYLSVGPTPNEMDQALATHFPQWKGFRQTVFADPWTAGDVFAQASYGGPEYALNSAVLLVTVGMALDWQEPSDGDLFGRAVQAGKTLHPLYVAYLTDEQVREAYPRIGNASTYALYRFFGEDLEKLRTWCRTYSALFAQSYPLRP